MKRYYRGWRIIDNGPNYHPVTGRFRATRWGVSMGTNTEKGLIRMIDQHATEEYNARFSEEMSRAAGK